MKEQEKINPAEEIKAETQSKKKQKKEKEIEG